MKNKKMKTKIAIFGPHDRFNYGDFLFPLMLEYAIEKSKPNTYKFEKFSLVSSDFTELGAFKSKNYRNLKRNINGGKIDVLIVAGGECLIPTWHDLLGCISKKYVYFYQKRNFRRVLKRINFARSFLGGTSEYPYCLNKEDFKKSFCLIYNSVGSVLPYTDKHIQYLNQADYLALRDLVSFSNAKVLDIKSYLIPDSAIVLSDVFPISEVQQSPYIRNEKIKLLISEKRKYIFFQISKYLTDNKIEEISSQLKRIKDSLECEIVLCPIGTASVHEDDVPLGEIKYIYLPDAILIENPTINEILLLIANSDLYIGTSLHGVITSMSYGVPYVGLDGGSAKLASYVKTWGGKYLNQAYNVDGFESNVYEIFANEKIIEDIHRNTVYQKEVYYKSVETFLKTIK